MRLGRATQALIAVWLAGVAATGCGFKGPLTVPERSETVIIRAPGQGSGATPEGTGIPAGAVAPAPATTTIKPEKDRPPPPPLPGSTQGG